MAYGIVIHEDTLEQISQYKTDLAKGVKKAGGYLSSVIRGQDIAAMVEESFIEALLQTKKPQIFAEHAIIGDGQDWTYEELKILGNIGFSCSVAVYDDGAHRAPKVHAIPFNAHLLFTPGALLRNDQGERPVDIDIVNAKTRSIDEYAYYLLNERRLLPMLMHANFLAEKAGQKALVTIPGIGCGQFAGNFKGAMGRHLENAMNQLFENHGHYLTNIQAVYYDPFNECSPSKKTLFDGTTLIVNPLMNGNGHSQLSLPMDFDADLKDCMMFSVVAWDHVSWPGNDYWAGARMTDDGVKAAATDVMKQITGVEGRYDMNANGYIPPEPYATWQDVVYDKQIRLTCTKDNLFVYENGVSAVIDPVKFAKNIQALKVLVEFKAPLTDIEKGLDLENGQTPLMVAAMSGKTIELEYLAKQGADIWVKDDSGKTALDWARETKAAQCVSILEDRMLSKTIDSNTESSDLLF